MALRSAPITKTRKLENAKAKTGPKTPAFLMRSFRVFVLSCFRDVFLAYLDAIPHHGYLPSLTSFAASHTRAVPSALPDASILPSEDQARAVIFPWCPCNRRIS